MREFLKGLKSGKPMMVIAKVTSGHIWKVSLAIHSFCLQLSNYLSILEAGLNDQRKGHLRCHIEYYEEMNWIQGTWSLIGHIRGFTRIKNDKNNVDKKIVVQDLAINDSAARCEIVIKIASAMVWITLMNDQQRNWKRLSNQTHFISYLILSARWPTHPFNVYFPKF